MSVQVGSTYSIRKALARSRNKTFFNRKSGGGKLFSAMREVLLLPLLRLLLLLRNAEPCSYIRKGTHRDEPTCVGRGGLGHTLGLLTCRGLSALDGGLLRDILRRTSWADLVGLEALSISVA